MSVDPGLCGDCVHARTVRGARSVFWICGRSATDSAYPRYPRLPVSACPGYERGRSSRPARRPPPAQPPGATGRRC